MKQMLVPASLEGMLSWRCGYATGLRVALRLMREAKDPPRRIKSELRSAMVEARDSYREMPAPRLD